MNASFLLDKMEMLPKEFYQLTQRKNKPGGDQGNPRAPPFPKIKKQSCGALHLPAPGLFSGCQASKLALKLFRQEQSFICTDQTQWEAEAICSVLSF